MARPFRIGATGVWVVLATRTNHPNSETGRAVFQCAAGRSRSTTFCNVTGLRVRPNPPALPKLLGTSNQAVDPQRSINEVGQSNQKPGPITVPIDDVVADPLFMIADVTIGPAQPSIIDFLYGLGL